MKRTVRSIVGEVTIRDNGLVMVRAFSNAEVELEQAVEYHAMVDYLTQGLPHATVIDISGISYVSKESREFLSAKSSEWGKTVAVGFVTNSFTARMIGNFFLTINRPSYPVKLFTDPLLAQQWARGEYLKFATRMAS